MPPKSKRQRHSWGALRRLPSGRWQASYVGPDLVRHNAPTTFTAKLDAEAWLVAERLLIERGGWASPATRARTEPTGATLAAWAPAALERRRVRGQPLRPRTLAHYRGLLERTILPPLGDVPLRALSAERVSSWYDALDPSQPTRRAHAYQLLRALLSQAVDEGVIESNPARVRGAGRATRAREIVTASPAEIAAIANAMPPRLRALVLIGAWGSLRFGELAELRRRDVDLRVGTVRVSRAVVRVGGEYVVGPPKSAAGVRTVHLPRHVVAEVGQHLDEHVDASPDALLFGRPSDPTQHYIHTEVAKAFKKAATAVGRPDLTLHALRHTGAVLAAQSGATLAELQARLGHSTVGAAMTYQHAAAGRDAVLAERMGALADAPLSGEPHH